MANRPMASDNLSVKRYPILRLIGVFYKFVAILLLIFSIVVALVFILQLGARVNTLGFLASFGIAYLFSGGFAALSFYAISRLIDLFLETNNNTRQIAEALQEQTRLLQQIHKRQANPYPRPSDAVNARKTYLKSDDPVGSPD